MAAAIKITRDDLDAAGLRRAARRAPGVAASRRMLALALVPEGASRAEAAQTAGMDRQALRDRVHRHDKDGPAGLIDRPGGFGPKRRLPAEQESERAEWVRRGPDLAGHGVVPAERSVGSVLRRLGLRRLVPRPRRPGQDAAAQASFRPVPAS